MKTYNGSPKHMANLAAARGRLTGMQRACVHCSKLVGLQGIFAHERWCASGKACPVCSTVFRTKGTTCSHACANTFFRTGEAHGNWNPARYTSTCFANHKKACVVCGEANIVSVHHLDENRANNDPANLIPLCPTHHVYWHSRFRHIVEAKVYAYLNEWKKQRLAQPGRALGLDPRGFASSNLATLTNV